MLRSGQVEFGGEGGFLVTTEMMWYKNSIWHATEQQHMLIDCDIQNAPAIERTDTPLAQGYNNES